MSLMRQLLNQLIKGLLTHAARPQLLRMLLQILISNHAIPINIDHCKIILQISGIFLIPKGGLDSVDELREGSNIVRVALVFSLAFNRI